MQQHPLRRLGTLALCILLALAPSAVLADALGGDFVFPYEGFRLAAAPDWRVLTQHNLAEHTEFLSALGTSEDAMLASFQAEHVVMEILPEAGGQITLAIVSDAGLNRVETDALLAAYQAMPRYQQVAFSPDAPEWLRMVFTSQQANLSVYTLRYVTLAHGQQYMLSSSVIGREPTEADDKLVLDVIGRLSFLSQLASPEPTPSPSPEPTAAPTPRPTPGVAPMISEQPGMALDAQPPAWTDAYRITITGTAEPEAELRFMLGDKMLARGASKKNGSFSQIVTLPESGELELRIEAIKDGQKKAAKSYRILFEQPVVPLTMTEPVGPMLKSEFPIRGQTAPYAKVSILGEKLRASTTANVQGLYSMRVKIAEEGTHEYLLVASTPGYADGKLDISITRQFTEREAIAAFRTKLVPSDYAKLVKTPDAYTGKNMNFRGRVTDVGESNGKPCLLISTALAEHTDESADSLWIISDQPLSYQVGDVATFYVRPTGESMQFRPVTGKVLNLPVCQFFFANL